MSLAVVEFMVEPISMFQTLFIHLPHFLSMPGEQGEVGGGGRGEKGRKRRREERGLKWVSFFYLHNKLHHLLDLCLHTWQSRIEIEYYSIAYFERITGFDAL